MYWHAEGMKTAYAGEVEFDGEKYEVTPERCYGYADKNWGQGDLRRLGYGSVPATCSAT